MRITARTFAHIASNSTLVFANTGLVVLAASSSAEAQPDKPASSIVFPGDANARGPSPCAAREAPPAAAALRCVAQGATSITLWDEITPPAPAVPSQPPPVQQQVPVPVDAGHEAGIVSA
jgi:hypothetical protein